jgi:RNA polymerase sigma-70 factor (ECF subfamily)
LTQEKLKIFEQLFKTLFRPLCNFSLQYVRDLDDAKGIVHDVFVIVYEKFESLPSDANYKSYLYTAVRNRCLNHIRDARKHVTLDNLSEQAVARHETPLETLELQTRIDSVIASLPEKCRMVFELNRIEGLKYAEIAHKMQISVKTVEAQMTKALGVLREHLAEFLTLIFFLLCP